MLGCPAEEAWPDDGKDAQPNLNCKTCRWGRERGGRPAGTQPDSARHVSRSQAKPAAAGGSGLGDSAAAAVGARLSTSVRGLR